MKKILSILLLLAFCSVQGTFAADVVIIGSDGQARYENENKNIPTIQTNNGGYSKMDFTDNNKNASKSVKVISNWINKTFEPGLIKYIDNIPKEIADYNSLLKKYGYELKDNGLQGKKSYTIYELLDGDYVRENQDCPIMAEYHKDGTLMGIVIKEFVIKEHTICKNLKTDSAYIYREYRINSNNKAELKHVMFKFSKSYKDAAIDSRCIFCCYIYDKKGKLLCRRLDYSTYDDNGNIVERIDDIYVAEGSRNMISNLKKEKTYFYTSTPKKVREAVENSPVLTPFYPYAAFGALILSTYGDKH